MMMKCDKCFGTGTAEMPLHQSGSDASSQQTCPDCNGDGELSVDDNDHYKVKPPTEEEIKAFCEKSAASTESPVLIWTELDFPIDPKTEKMTAQIVSDEMRGIYVPSDANHPYPRLGFIVERPPVMPENFESEKAKELFVLLGKRIAEKRAER